ncbi:hypothetical protein BDFB_011122 [Asbolus verrucosus]|uniref:Uncharacterized protein n=1 Tax=Asbolus verrucosus TaxID=1661398 RepID=A0A482V902_ASBVE|nr:hypothetical protein BDFB_011122 [Asbolus verrucosus]
MEHKVNKNMIWLEDNTPRFTGEATHRRKSGKVEKPTTLAITNILPPEDFQCFNTGSSLEKWSKKPVRLKSAKATKSPTEDDKDFCYETLETDLSLLLNEPEEELSQDGSLSNLQYEVHTDIEQLLLKNENSTAADEVKEKSKRRRKTRGKDKPKKTIKFSISKPPSPQTEQVIRVDVTSNVSAGECRRAESALAEDNCSKGRAEMIDDKRKELKRNLNESSAEMCDEDFIVRCRQLALRQRRRRL